MTVYSIFAMIAAVAFVLALIRFVIDRPPNILITFVQDFIGSFFIFSGFVKAVDPLGTSYKMHEYFDAFAVEGLRPFWDYLASFSTFFAIVMIALELFVGLMLIIGWKPRLTAGFIWLLTLFFTLLTGYTYLSGYCISKLFLLLSAVVMGSFAAVAFPEKQSRRVNITFFAFGLLITVFLFSKFSGRLFLCGFTETKMQVTDCGCFGDFIKLKPWETFYKDCILDVLILFLVLNIKFVRPVFPAMFRNGLAWTTGIFSVTFCLYNVYLNDPVIDFRPYKIGNNVRDLQIEKQAPVLDMVFRYKNKKTGEIKSYAQADLGKLNMDKNQFVDRQDKVIDPGKPAVITNLIIENDEGDITDSLLANPNYNLMVVIFDLEQTHTKAFAQLDEIAAACDKIGVKFYAVSCNNTHLDEFRHKYNTAFPFYSSDATPLKTIIRSNPGLVLFKDGVVINKWHYLHLPTFEELNKNYFSKK